jgi:hypothetical protein
MIIRPIVAYPILIIAGMIGFAIGGNIGNKSSVENTLKMCNQKPLECKFKYDILMYNETGKIPYTQEKVTPIKK